MWWRSNVWWWDQYWRYYLPQFTFICFDIASILIFFYMVLVLICFKQCDGEAMCGGGTNIEDIHLAQFTFTEGAKLSPAGSKNSLGTIIMIRPSPHHSNTHSTTHSCTVAQMWDPPSVSLVWEFSTRNSEITNFKMALRDVSWWKLLR